MLRMLSFMVFLFGSFATISADAAQRKAPTPPPLVRMEAPPPIQVVESPSWSYGSWTARDMGDFSIASTVNESGSAFGAVCGKDCVWFVNFQSECTVGDEYPAMVNSPAGAYAVQLHCYYLDKRWLLTYAMTDDSITTIAKGGEIGFAFPFASGKFGVSRFALQGGAEAVYKAIDVIVKRRERNQEGLRDFTI